jgi:hypothetical protein
MFCNITIFFVSEFLFGHLFNLSWSKNISLYKIPALWTNLISLWSKNISVNGTICIIFAM